ncbi:hypothetical protein LshimejAT787_1104080 [Lyophyllum shimeji]|uniref:Uncharacterized protein n=1 Tax=Lyophyllum shimeji TaxID=47721 RepID=A0A9P3PVL0_LYOSH|nr:hypothetical protein LshimejAT787_1104080 [Lyophyllum shimeji]
MVRLGSGYVMKAELGMKIAATLGINPEQNNIQNARVHINRYTQARIPNFPMLRGIEYAPFQPDFAYILVTRHEDDNRKRKFKERPLDLGILSIVIGEFKLLAVAPYHVDFLDCFCPIPLRRSSPLSPVPLCSMYISRIHIFQFILFSPARQPPLSLALITTAAWIAVGLSDQVRARRTVLPTLHGNMPYTRPRENWCQCQSIHPEYTI